MNDTQIQQAIEYNQKQGYEEDEVRLIQEVTGSTPDGIWGPRTVLAVAWWQEEQGLKGDGKVGPKTFEAIGDFEECPSYQAPSRVSTPSGVVIGLWGDDNPHRMKKESYADRLAELGVSEVALMTNRANVSSAADPWDLRWEDEGEEGYEDDVIAEIAETYRARGISLILTSWPRPDKTQIDEMVAAMIPLLAVTKAKAWEVDVEGNWARKFLQGFPSMEAAATYLVSEMERGLAEAGIEGETESTTYGHHAELARHPTVTPKTDRACIQGYSTSPRRSGRIEWDSYLGPGKHQEWIFRRAQKANAKAIVMGLAAYKQAGFVGHTAREAMDVAYQKTLELGVRHIRYWSSKWVLGALAHRTPYAAEHLKAIQG